MKWIRVCEDCGKEEPVGVDQDAPVCCGAEMEAWSSDDFISQMIEGE